MYTLCESLGQNLSLQFSPLRNAHKTHVHALFLQSGMDMKQEVDFMVVGWPWCAHHMVVCVCVCAMCVHLFEWYGQHIVELSG